MFERFGEPARRSLFFSRDEARALGSRSIETEHLLLGILKERDPLVTHLIGSATVTPERLEELIYARARRSAAPVTSVEIPFSQDAKQVLLFAAEEGHCLLHRHIGNEHVLLGLLRVERGLAATILREQGLRLTPVREALVTQIGATSPPPPEIAGMIAAMSRTVARAATRPGMDVYVLTAGGGPSPGRRGLEDNPCAEVGGVASFCSAGFNTRTDHPPNRVHRIGPISMRGTTVGALALVLEDFLGRPVIDNSGIAVTCDIELKGEYDNPDALIAALRDQLGLVLTRA